MGKKLTLQERTEYDKAWKAERNRIMRKARELEKKGFILAEDFVPPIHPKQRRQASLRKITEFRGDAVYKKAAYPIPEKGILKGKRGLKAYQEQKKHQQPLPKPRNEAPKKPPRRNIKTLDNGLVIDADTGEVIDDSKYREKQKESDREWQDTDTGEYEYSGEDLSLIHI